MKNHTAMVLAGTILMGTTLGHAKAKADGVFKLATLRRGETLATGYRLD